MADGTWHECYKCKSLMWTPAALNEAAKAARRKIEFFCAYGHAQVYGEGETEETKLRRERDRLAQRIAEKDDEITRQSERREAAERSAAAFRGQVTKIKRRVSGGACPCCQRSFQDLRRHMESKHPEFGKPDTSNVVPFKAEASSMEAPR